jgi:DNA polymerase-3 subunit delta'
MPCPYYYACRRIVVHLESETETMQFAHVIGHNDLKKRLIQAVASGRIPHAQRFFGPEGAGTLALALAYARYVLCTGKENVAGKAAPDSCGKCPSCLQFSKLAHPDLHFIFPVATTPKVSKNPVSRLFYDQWRNFVVKHQGYGNLTDWYNEIGIDRKQGLINAEDCSEILKTLSYKSYQGGYKVMIIWMVEKLFHAAAPKILKVLEEPPDQTLFILVTENPAQIIPTILSRTQGIKVPAISDPALQDALISLAGEKKSLVPEIVRRAQGNFREAMRLMEDERPDHLLFEQFRTWMRLCFKKNVAEIQGWVREFASEGREGQKHFLSYALGLLREALLYDIRGESLSRLSAEELDFIRNFSPYIHRENAPEFVQGLENGIQHIERNANAGIMMSWLSLQFSDLLRMKAA